MSPYRPILPRLQLSLKLVLTGGVGPSSKSRTVRHALPVERALPSVGAQLAATIAHSPDPPILPRRQLRTNK